MGTISMLTGTLGDGNGEHHHGSESRGERSRRTGAGALKAKKEKFLGTGRDSH